MIKIEGKVGISATVLADSVSPEGVRLTTFEITYPRIILSELNTHRMLSKNSASSRAIPFEKIEPTLTGRPVRFGQANPGMQDKGEDFNARIASDTTLNLPGLTPEEAWRVARGQATTISKFFYEAGFHKQVFNRLTEPFQMMKTVISGTEWENFFWLRNDTAADPTLHELARCIKEARDASQPFPLQPGQWHLPYVDWLQHARQQLLWKDEFGAYIPTTWEDLRKVSAARCAAVSFRNTDYTLEKSLQVYDRLVGDERKHASAFEHQATPMKELERGTEYVNFSNIPDTWEPGITHTDRKGNLWSGNLRGWVQFRKLISGENKEG